MLIFFNYNKFIKKIYIFINKKRNFYILIYVNDIILIVLFMDIIEILFQKFKKFFNFKKIRKIVKYFDMEIKYNKINL